MKDTLSYLKMGDEFEWRKWADEIPYIKFPTNWEISIIPPFSGAISRFRVKNKNSKHFVSVYLDCYDLLGCFGSPYWEVYPFKGDVGRCGINNTKKLLEMISLGLEEINK